MLPKEKEKLSIPETEKPGVSQRDIEVEREVSAKHASNTTVLLI